MGSESQSRWLDEEMKPGRRGDQHHPLRMREDEDLGGGVGQSPGLGY